MGWIIELVTCGITGEREMEEAMLPELATSNNFSDSKDVEHDGTRGAHDLKLFSFDSIVAATNYFSSENKLGEGGFGLVYKVNIIISLIHGM